MSNPKVDQFNPGVGHIFVQQHDILRLFDQTEGEINLIYSTQW